MKTWETFLNNERQEPYFKELLNKVAEARKTTTVFPSEEEMFSCFTLCPYDKVKVVILGQDPYHGVGQAHGLSFSVKPGVKVPPSLRNIYKELKADLNIDPPSHGYLEEWAKQGVLMMNTGWSVEEGKAASHKKFGWKQFTNRILTLLNEYPEPLVFILWGNHAIDVAKGLITNPKHLLLTGVHPSPLAARGGFFGSKPFSKTNEFLRNNHRGEINWKLRELSIK